LKKTVFCDVMPCTWYKYTTSETLATSVFR